MRPKLSLFYPIIAESSSPFYDFVNNLSFRIEKRTSIGKYGAFCQTGKSITNFPRFIENHFYIYYNQTVTDNPCEIAGQAACFRHLACFKNRIDRKDKACFTIHTCTRTTPVTVRQRSRT